MPSKKVSSSSSGSAQATAIHLPKVLEAYGANGDRVRIEDVYTNDFVTVEVPSYGMAAGHTVRGRWKGVSTTTARSRGWPQPRGP